MDKSEILRSLVMVVIVAGVLYSSYKGLMKASSRYCKNKKYD